MADPFISPEDLSALLHVTDAPAILDMRDGEDSAADRRRIPGARAMELADLEANMGLAGPVVCTCQKGGKLSQIGAGLLRARGVPAQSLRGGHLAWVAAGLPLVGAARLAERWVMPLDPGWEELAAFWVLRRLVDRTAPVMPVERDWLAPATQVWAARAVPGSAGEMADLAGLDHPVLPRLSGGPDRLVRGRMARVLDPADALDLIDDWLAAPRVAA